MHFNKGSNLYTQGPDQDTVGFLCFSVPQTILLVPLPFTPATLGETQT